MIKDFKPNVINAIQALYEENPDAKKLFDWTASLGKDAAETSIDRITSVLSISRKSAVALAHELEAAGCGYFIVGRRGAKSRFEWLYSRISLGQVAAGEIEEIDPVSDDTVTDDDEIAECSEESPLTIPEAKERLARALNIHANQIEIIIKG